MKQAEASVQYTIRGIPPEVDRALRLKASQRRLSLNQILLDELSQATVGQTVKADFSDLVGKWTPDPAFDEVIASQRKIDRAKWR